MRFKLNVALRFVAVVAVWAGAGCADNQADPGPGLTTSTLERPIAECQTQQASCLFGAKAPADARTCNDSFGKCLLDSAQKVAGIMQSVDDCQTKAISCVRTGGASGVPACRMDFESCVKSASDTDAGTATTPSAPSSPGLPLPGRQAAGAGGSLPGVPTPGLPSAGFPKPVPQLPNAGAPALPNFPRPGVPDAGVTGAEPAGFACLDDLRSCVRGGKPASDCAKQARACLSQQAGSFPSPTKPELARMNTRRL
jgi:hypothetical protein